MSLEKLREIAEARAKKGKKSDPNRFVPDFGTTHVRFLPAVAESEAFFKSYGEHWIETDEGKKMFLCPRLSLGKKCPICEIGFELYATGDADDALLARNLMPSNRNVANVLVYAVDDDGNEKLVGPKQYKFGKKLGEKLVDECVDEEIDIADKEEGYDYKIVKKKVKEGDRVWPQYDSSRIDMRRQSPLDDDYFEEVMGKVTDIHGEIDSQVLSYKDLQTAFQGVTGTDDDTTQDTTETDTKSKPAPKKSKVEKVKAEDWDEDEFLAKVNEAIDE